MNSTAFFWPMKFTFKIYIIISIVFITAQLSQYTILENISKPLLMLSLMFGFAFHRKWRFRSLDYTMLAALFFSLLGDAFLMPLFDSFMAGLVSFLIAHICYIYLFTRDIQKPIQLSYSKVALGILGLTIFMILLGLIYNSLIPQNAPVLFLIAIGLYATVLLGMYLTALFRRKEAKSSYLFTFIGAAFFLISDSFLAINKFVIPLPYSTLWVIPSYSLAQALILYGFLNRMPISKNSK